MLVRRILLILVLLAMPAHAAGFEVVNKDLGYSFSLPEGWRQAPASVVKGLKTEPDAKTRFVEAFVARGAKGEIDSRLAVYVNRSGKFNAKNLKGNMETYAREDLERMQAWAKTKGSKVRSEHSFDGDRKTASFHYHMGGHELHKFYFFTSGGYVYVKLWGENSDRILGARPFVANVKLDDKTAFETKWNFDWEWLKMDYVFWIIFGLVIFFKVKKWIMPESGGKNSAPSSRGASPAGKS
ncbi:hypothetical protein [Salidesulfovibrio onnuriiensis]|uniref:hypothetical protein n=1 Tax=Salidesulfovibrio onnuriiensis TaxID=2583823 RepID=UPI0011CB3741|nr:hypothetical protein [Salidesulfovibrio onnuriiensis]